MSSLWSWIYHNPIIIFAILSHFLAGLENSMDRVICGQLVANHNMKKSKRNTLIAIGIGLLISTFVWALEHKLISIE